MRSVQDDPLKKERARLKRIASDAGRGIFDFLLQIFPLFDEVGIVLEEKRRTRIEMRPFADLEAYLREHAPERIALVKSTPVPAHEDGTYCILAVGKNGLAVWSVRKRPAPVAEETTPKRKPRKANLAVA